ncbi:cytochrome P450 306a1 isoform X1 [Vespa crabro]|uniref:cytochrome P450 306a1 isoform X1 n=2 Tax=Vespa crabro TaxID=7445 RepID=UPI001EFFD2EA|nr:cytochrome P450 306a1 isoform X1 [Vespa crabro]
MKQKQFFHILQIIIVIKSDRGFQSGYLGTFKMFTIILIFILLMILYYMIRKRYRLPPGPWCLPIVGYLPWIDPEAPHETFTELIYKYGPICGLKLGSVYTVLLSDPRLIRQVLAKDAFCGRAPLYLTHGIMSGHGLICAEGELWKDQRRFVAECLKNLGMIKYGQKRDKMERRILVVVEECISKLEERSTSYGFDPNETLQHCVGNLMNDLVLGKTYQENDFIWAWLRTLQEEGVKRIGVAGPLNFLPFLRFIPRYGKMMYSLIDGKKKTHEIYRSIVEEHRISPVKTESILAAFEDQMASRKDSDDFGYFNEVQFYHLLADIFGAGLDTTVSTLRWFLLFIAAYPEEQEKIYQEMQQMLENKEPTLDDRIVLTRLEATIAEVQRLRSVVPVGMPHGTIEDAKIGDYDIPKGTMVIPVQWSVHTDESYWDNAFDFKPDRFIDDDGRFFKPEGFLPFQSGKRMCVGDKLARMIMFLFCSRIIHKFDVSVPPNVSINLKGDTGITLVPKPHRLVFTPRKT